MAAAVKVVVTDYTFPTLQQEQDASRAAGAEFAAFQCRTAEDVAAAVAGAKVARVQFAPAAAAAAARLAPGAAVIRYGVGYDNIDVAACTERGISVSYVPDYCADEVADHTAASLLSLLRKLPALDASVRAGDWKAVAVAKPIKGFGDALVGFFGFGHIGRLTYARLKPFGFRFAVADPMVTAEQARELGLELMDAETLFRKADAICLHAPANPATRFFVNAERLSGMQSHAVIVNTARGALIDEAALAAALGAGTIGGAALDVFNAEPLPADSPLRAAPNLILTPHAAWYSDGAIARLQELVAGDIAAWLNGKPLRRPAPGSLRGAA